MTACILSVTSQSKRPVLAALDYHRGLIFINTEERSAGEKALVAREHKRATGYLEESEGLYHVYKGAGRGPPIPDAFNPEEMSDEDRWKMIDNLHTHTLFYLAQVYGLLQLKDKSAEYCRMTLKRQLLNKDVNKVTWATDCMNLSQYYASIAAFPQAHHCLTAAEEMLAKESASRDAGGAEEEGLQRTQAELAYVYAYLRWLWGNFYLEALKVSVERYVETDSEVPESTELGEDLLANQLAGTNFFDQLDLSPKRPQVPSQYAQSYEEAQRLFLEGLSCLERAKKFFPIDGFVSDH
ncbi:hypothetical protein HK104_005599, partial [Borealophlyctis nickersoniae]